MLQKLRRAVIGCFLALVIFTSSGVFSGCSSGNESQSQSQQQEQSSGDTIDSEQSSGGSGSSDGQQEEDGVKFTFTVDASKLHTNLQLSYLSDSYENVSKYADGTKELSKPQPIRFKWQSSQTATNCELKISENENLSNAKTISVKTKEIKISNLKVHTKYYYQMTATVGGKTVTSEVKSFTTGSFLPRLIDCDGVTNMRDLGGYNVDGGVVKQGLVYRSGRFNESYVNTINVEVTEKGMETLRELGIKTEIDLRTTVHDYNELGGYEKLDVGPLGEDVNYYKCPMIYKSLDGSDSVHTPARPQNYAEIRKIFAYFADESNYPLVFHCNIGTDRTGYISYLLNGMLGVSKEDLFRDYLFSNFGNIGGSRGLSRIFDYVDAIDACEGATLAEKVETYLTQTIGVPQENIDKIREIMIEKNIVAV